MKKEKLKYKTLFSFSIIFHVLILTKYRMALQILVQSYKICLNLLSKNQVLRLLFLIFCHKKIMIIFNYIINYIVHTWFWILITPPYSDYAWYNNVTLKFLGHHTQILDKQEFLSTPFCSLPLCIFPLFLKRINNTF